MQIKEIINRLEDTANHFDRTADPFAHQTCVTARELLIVQQITLIGIKACLDKYEHNPGVLDSIKSIMESHELYSPLKGDSDTLEVADDDRQA